MVQARTVRDVPHWFRSSLRRAYRLALDAHHSGRGGAAWKLFELVPCMLLRHSAIKGATGKKVFVARIARFLRGEWMDLLAEAHARATTWRATPPASDEQLWERLPKGGKIGG